MNNTNTNTNTNTGPWTMTVPDSDFDEVVVFETLTVEQAVEAAAERFVDGPYTSEVTQDKGTIEVDLEEGDFVITVLFTQESVAE